METWSATTFDINANKVLILDVLIGYGAKYVIDGSAQSLNPISFRMNLLIRSNQCLEP